MKFFITLGLCVSIAAAQTTSLNITTTAVPFLRISPDARAGGMADMGVATAPDASSAFHNLAKLPFVSEPSAISGGYTPWMRDVVNDVYLGSLTGYYKIGDDQAVAASLRYFNLGELPIYDNNGTKLQTADPREWAADLGYTRKLSDALSLGAAFRFINSNMAAGTVGTTTYKTGRAFAGDLSLYYHHDAWSGGLTLTNLGSRIGYTNDATGKDFLPATANLGLSYEATFDEQNSLRFSGEVNKLLVPSFDSTYYTEGIVSSWFKSFGSSDYSGGLGMEYAYDHSFYARVGYHFDTQSYLTAGLGLRYRVAQLDLSYLAPSGNGVTRNPLSNTVRFGVTFFFGNKTAQP